MLSQAAPFAAGKLTVDQTVEIHRAEMRGVHRSQLGHFVRIDGSRGSDPFPRLTPGWCPQDPSGLIEEPHCVVIGRCGATAGAVHELTIRAKATSQPGSAPSRGWGCGAARASVRTTTTMALRAGRRGDIEPPFAGKPSAPAWRQLPRGFTSFAIPEDKREESGACHAPPALGSGEKRLR